MSASERISSQIKSAFGLLITNIYIYLFESCVRSSWGMSVWTTSTTGLETALAAAIGSTLQQHTHTITNNLKGQPHIVHIGNSVNSASIASSLHHLNHNSGNNNINVNQLQHHHHHSNSPHQNYTCKYRILCVCVFFTNCCDELGFDSDIFVTAHNNLNQQSFLNRGAGICSNHHKVSDYDIFRSLSLARGFSSVSVTLCLPLEVR